MLTRQHLKIEKVEQSKTISKYTNKLQHFKVFSFMKLSLVQNNFAFYIKILSIDQNVSKKLRLIIF